MNKTVHGEWTADGVQKIIKHYDSQSEVDAVTEDESAYEHDSQTIMEIPSGLVPKVRELIVKNPSASS